MSLSTITMNLQPDIPIPRCLLQNHYKIDIPKNYFLTKQTHFQEGKRLVPSNQTHFCQKERAP